MITLDNQADDHVMTIMEANLKVDKIYIDNLTQRKRPETSTLGDEHAGEDGDEANDDLAERPKTGRSWRDGGSNIPNQFVSLREPDPSTNLNRGSSFTSLKLILKSYSSTCQCTIG